MSVTLRPYQRESALKVSEALDVGEHPLCVLPTGAGKSLVMAEVLRKRAQPALVLSHVAELLEQDARALRRVAPNARSSFFVAGLKEKNAHADIVFGSVQSVVRSLAEFRSPRSLIFVDEAHLCPRKGDAMYAKIFAHFMQARRVGMTATPRRLDSGSLVSGDDAWFSCVAHSVDVRELIVAGFLSPLVGVTTEAQASMEGVATRGGDFVMEQAAAAVARTLELPTAVAQACKLARKRKAWLVFAASIEHAEAVAHELTQQGVANLVVTSETSRDDRNAALDQFRAGEVRALVNVGVLTTGFDAPLTDAIICMRPTQSDVLWQQILGRGMRLAEGKTNCLLLDFVGNLERLGGVGCVTETFDYRAPADIARASARAQEKKRRAQKREAPELFDPSSDDPMVNGKTFEASVRHVSFFTVPSRRYPGRTLLCAAYDIEDDLGRALKAREFLCVEYPGNARFMAVRWFGRRGLVPTQVPAGAREALALARVLDAPSAVLVRYEPRLSSYVIVDEQFSITAT